MDPLEDAARQLLEAPNFAQPAAVRKDGSAAVTPTWFDFDDVLRGTMARTEIDGHAHHDKLRRRYRGRGGGDLDFGDRVVFGLTIERAAYRYEPPPGSGQAYDDFLAARLGDS